MTRQQKDPQLPQPYFDWIVFSRSWGTWSEPCATIQEARELSGRTGHGPIYRRVWEMEGQIDS